MNLQFYLEKIRSSSEYTKFLEENPKSYFCSGFFAIDKEGKDNKIHLDFYVPSSKKIFSFQLEDGINLVPVDTIEPKIPEKISEGLDFDFEEVEKIIEEKVIEQGVKNKLQKILLSLQKIKDKELLVGTVFVSMLGMLKVNIDIEKMEIILFEKRSFFEIMKVVKKKD